MPLDSATAREWGKAPRKPFSRDTKVQALKRAALFDGLSRKELTQLAGADR